MGPSPTYRKSVFDHLTDAISPGLRKVSDVYTRLFSTQAQVLRITRKVLTRKTNTLTDKSVLGDYYDDLEAYIMHGVNIVYPFNDLEVFISKVGSESIPTHADVNVGSIDITDIMPIVAILEFKGDYEEDPVEVNEGDKIIDVFWDHKNNPIPIALEVKRFRSSFFGKNEISKRVELAVWRGPFSTEMQKIMNDYMTYIKDERDEFTSNQVLR